MGVKAMELKEFLNEKTKTTKHTCLTQHLISYPKEREEIIKQTNYLPEDCKFTERIYHVLNNLKKRPKCFCGKKKKFNKYLKRAAV